MTVVDCKAPLAASARLPRPMALALLAALIVLLPGGKQAEAGFAPPRRPAPVAVDGAAILVHGFPYVVKGVHYGPRCPGTGARRPSYPSPDAVEADLALVEELHANTILVHDAPRYVLDAAHAWGLRALCCLSLDWHRLGTRAFAAREHECLAEVLALRAHPALLGWVLGDEVPPRVVEEHGTEAVEGALRALHRRVKAIDPGHLVTHACGPGSRSLGLDFLDVFACKARPPWPTRTAGEGPGQRVLEVLRPNASGRPILITDFGASSLLAGLDGQARLVRDCWEEIRAAGCAGGFAFELADSSGATGAPDPADSYGLVTSDRRRKPAFAAVTEMFAAEGSQIAVAAWVLGAIVFAVGSLAWCLWFTGRRSVSALLRT